MTRFARPCATRRPERSPRSRPRRSTSSRLRRPVFPGKATPICWPPDRQPARGDDVLVGAAEGGARHRAHSAGDVPGRSRRSCCDGVIDLTARELPRFGVASPRLALAGLNPHAGEDGLLGEEDERVLRPAVEAARGARRRHRRPFPGDTVFVRASRGEFDVVIACYHDQGLIPVKLLAFGDSVNVTLGLPIIRTSVDHGTAFDIAGKGRGRSIEHDRGDAPRRPPRDRTIACRL